MGGPSRPLRVVRDNWVRAFDNLSAWSSSRWGDVRRGAFLSLDCSLPRKSMDRPIRFDGAVLPRS